VFACLIVRCLSLVVELQRKLNVPWGLGSRDLSHGRSKVHVWCVELNVVESIDEVGPKLQFEPLSE
jgi:hypothetical protein